MKLPLLAINFKNYPEAVGRNAIKLARICKVKGKVSILVAPQTTNLKEVSKIKVKTLAQHIDPVDVGAHTGHITAKDVKESGSIGTFINHSERKLTLDDVKKCIKLAKKYKLLSLCFATNEKEASKITKFDPDFIIYEPPELIGTGISVSQSKPKIIKKVVDLVKKKNSRIKVLCGAGITNGKDVKNALKLGTKGVVLSSAFVKAKNPQKVLKNLLSGF